jgi:hypothetical protein
MEKSRGLGKKIEFIAFCVTSDGGIYFCMRVLPVEVNGIKYLGIHEVGDNTRKLIRQRHFWIRLMA